MKMSLFFVRVFIPILFFTGNIKLQAQTSALFETVGAEKGLSQGMVYDILQDKEGFIWVGTKDGLNRFDGYSFKVFTNDPKNSQTLSSNSINDLFEDSKGRIWVGTQNDGLNVYDKKTGNFLRILSKKNQPNTLSDNVIKLMEESPDGRMLVATEDGNINIISLAENFLDKKTTPTIVQVSLPDKSDIYGIGIDPNKNIWIGGMTGNVYQFDITKNYFTQFANAKLLNNGYFTKSEEILINNNLYLYYNEKVTPLFDTKKYPEGNIILKPNSSLWDKHHRELSFYDVTSWGVEKKVDWTLKLPSTKRLQYPFMFDKSGIIWVGTVGYGLKKFNVNTNKFNTQAIGFSIYNISPIDNSELIVGDVAYSWKRIKNETILENNIAQFAEATQLDNLLISSTGDYWLKSDNKGYFKYNPLSKKLKRYASINYDNGIGSKQPLFEDSKHRIWFIGLAGLYQLMDKTTEQITPLNININAEKPMDALSITTAIFEDKSGIFWVGTLNGFAKVQLNEGSAPIIKWYSYQENANSLNYNNVSSFLEDPNNPNFLWIGTKGGGLNRLDKTNNSFLHLTSKEGLPDNVVYGILSDAQGNIWGSTNKGLFCMLAQKNTKDDKYVFRNYSKSDGLQDNEFNTNAYSKMPNGYLAFGGVNGLNIFDPKEILANNFSPNVFITNILINNKPVVPNDKTDVLKYTIEQTKTITLSYQQDILTLEFASLDFTASGQNKYRYILEGADKEWVEAGTNRYATYLHLPAGSYTFKVQGTNSQGIWSDQITTLKIIVLPPWWHTWWAYLSYLLVIGAGVRAYFKFKVNKANLQNQLNYEQQEAKRIKELDKVKTQLYTNLTHEFRTPLTIILGMVQQIKQAPNEHLTNGLSMIERNGTNLLKMVNGMLDLSKLEAGKMDVQLKPGDIINFIRYLIESYNSLAASQNKRLHYLSTIDSVYTEYDAEKLSQIIANLLSNAIKFTPENGDIYISVSLANNNAKSLCIKVKDTGVGISEDQCEHIFERFYQVDSSHTRKAEGTGIGLALTKELVLLMGGTISVKSPPSGAIKGTEFTFTLPIQHITESMLEESKTFEPNLNKDAALSQTPTSQTKLGNLTNNKTPLILLVEDNADVVAYTASCLQDYKLAVGRDGKEGFEIACDIVPDIIITDVMMPISDGFEMTKKLRQEEKTSHIPIIMLTAKADLESKLEGIGYGADAYLQKPFYKDELLLRIKKLLESRKHLQEYYSKQITLNRPEAEERLDNVLVKATAAPTKLEHEFVNKVKEIVSANFNNYEFNVEHLCKLVFMSHSQLHRKLEALTGYSPNKFIRLIRLNKAKELLSDPSQSISNIATDCGYNDPSYFTRVFKQDTGLTPLEWRNKLQ